MFTIPNQQTDLYMLEKIKLELFQKVNKEINDSKCRVNSPIDL